MQVEVHLQEGFSDLPVTIEAGGAVVADFTATTRLMTGLARIVPLDLRHGEEVRVLAGNASASAASIRVDEAKPFVVVNFVNGKLHLKLEERQPGYL